MSVEPDSRGKDGDLERLLGGLAPTRLPLDVLAELHRSRERVAIELAHCPTRIHWRRVVPLTLVGTIVMAAFGVLQFGDRFRTPPAPEVSSAVQPLVEDRTAGLSEERFVPVSAQGFLLNATSGGVVQTDEGPREKMNMEYREAYHWHDPESGTNIRLFQPRNEEVVIPLRTD